MNQQNNGEHVKRCEACRTPLARKTFACGYRETPKQFEARRFCDYTCKMLRHRPRQKDGHPWRSGLRRSAA